MADHRGAAPFLILGSGGRIAHTPALRAIQRPLPSDHRDSSRLLLDPADSSCASIGGPSASRAASRLSTSIATNVEVSVARTRADYQRRLLGFDVLVNEAGNRREDVASRHDTDKAVGSDDWDAVELLLDHDLGEGANWRIGMCEHRGR